MRRLMAWALPVGGAAFVAVAPLPAAAQPRAGNGPEAAVVVSPAAESASVTIYRDPGRGERAFDLRWLQGYALISEKRRVHLPAGPAVLRFEGVADGMIGVSAVVSGLPGGVEEKNRDARLLSPAALLDGSLGNRVQLRRTDRATGRVTETTAIIRSAPGNGVVLETPQGVEALHCSGLNETLVYDGVPGDLSARPTFAVHTVSPQEGDAEITLTYLATGFDWNAHYIATLDDGASSGADGSDGRLDLFAWLTVANGNGASYAGAHLLAVAGKPNRTSDFRDLSDPGPQPRLQLQCWPQDTTRTPSPDSPPPPPPPPPMAAPVMIELRATMDGAMLRKASVAVMAEQEELGDLKLYRVPVAVDVLPNGQKQVALLHKAGVPFRRLYVGRFVSDGDEAQAKRPLGVVLRLKNETARGLGLPLPSGGVEVMVAGPDGERLVGQDILADKAVGEDVELSAGSGSRIWLATEKQEARKTTTFRLTVSNDRDQAVPVEIAIAQAGEVVPRASAALIRKDGKRLWATTVPAHGRASLQLRYRKSR